MDQLSIPYDKFVKIARYSFIQLSERGGCTGKHTCARFDTGAQDSNPSSLIKNQKL